MPVRIAFVGGGSVNWAIGLMSDLAFDRRLSAHVCLYDIDHAAALRNAEVGARFAEVSQGTPATYEACETLADALTGADVVVISILPGQFTDMAQDLEIPMQYGIAQSVGDTVGPGGFVRALRAIPMMAQIAEAIRDHAPNAFVCNLTNPMSVLTATLYKVFPDIKAWGECHEVTKIRKQVAWIANQAAGKDNYTHRDVDVTVAGINHFIFVNKIGIEGRDWMNDYVLFARQHRHSGWAQSVSSDPEKTKYFGSRNLVAFDLLERFGFPAAAGDRHLAEFFPAVEYLQAPGEWGFAVTPVSYRMKERGQRLQYVEAVQRGEIDPVACRSDEALIEQIVALIGGDSFVSNVNLPNTGQIGWLPEETIVETNATFGPDSISPLPGGRLGAPLEAIISGHATRQSALVRAVLTGDREALFPLFYQDPLVNCLAQDKAAKMYAEMVAATAKVVPLQLQGAA